MDTFTYGSVRGLQVKLPLAYSTEIGGKVIVRISVCPLTVSVRPNCVQLTPQLRQAAGTVFLMSLQDIYRNFFQINR